MKSIKGSGGFWENNWQIIFIFAIAVAARFVFLGLRPLEGDEGIIIKMAQSPNLSLLFSSVAADVHPPLFHFFEYIGLHALPFSEFWARFISALFSALLVFPLYGVIKILSDKKTALWVSTISIFSAILAYHGAEVRPYGLFTFVFFAQVYFLLNTLEKRSFLNYFLFFVLTLALLMTQYIGFIVLLGEGIYVLIKGGKARLSLMVTAFLSIGGFVLIWGSNFLHQLSGRSVEQSQALALKANLTGLFNALYRFGSGRLFLDLDPSISKNLEFFHFSPLLFVVFVLSVLLSFGLFIWGGILLYQKNKKSFWFTLSLVLPVVLAAAVSSEIGPRSVRYLSFLVPFYLFILWQVALYGKTFAKVCFALFLVIYLAAFVNGYYFERLKPGVNAIASYILDKGQRGDAILVRGGYGGGESLVLRYYLGNRADEFEITDLYADYMVGNLSQIKARNISDYLNKLKQENKKIWYYDFTYSTDETSLSFPFEKVLLGRDKEGKDLTLYSF